MPRKDFKITGRFKDALSRQVGEAMDGQHIFYSKDNILNSRYANNCIHSLTVLSLSGRERKVKGEKRQMMLLKRMK